MDSLRRLFSLFCLVAAACLTSPAGSYAEDGVPTLEGSVLTSLNDNSAAMMDVATTVQPCAGRCKCSACSCQPDAPWSLPQPCLFQQTGIKLGGWLQQGITLNALNSSDGFNGPVATNDFDDQYQMNQLWMYLDRPANTDGCGVAVGGHFDMIFGTDWRFGVNNGLEDRINGFDYQKYGLVIPQMYVEFAVNKLSVKLGHFAGILDYEAVPAVRNPFYSHSYCYAYTVPQLVTGLMGEYKLTDQFALQAGFNRGWVMFEDTNDTLDFMGGATWHSANQRTKVAYAINVGPEDPPADFNQVPGDQNRFVYSLVIQQQISEKLHYVAVQNLGTEQNAPTARCDRRMVRSQPVLSLHGQPLLASQPAHGVAARRRRCAGRGSREYSGHLRLERPWLCGKLLRSHGRSELATEWQLAGAAGMPLGLV